MATTHSLTVAIDIDDAAVTAARERCFAVMRDHRCDCSDATVESNVTAVPSPDDRSASRLLIELKCPCGWEYSLRTPTLMRLGEVRD